MFSSDRTNFISASCIVAMDVSISDKRQCIKINWQVFMHHFIVEFQLLKCVDIIFLIDEGS